LPRLRFDILQNIIWKFVLPLSIVFLIRFFFC
jgi:NADH:ubiquinone oxidoreductase subunit H